MLIAGLISLVIGVPLGLAGTAGLGRDITPTARPHRRGAEVTMAQNPGESRTGASGYPVRFLGFLDQRLSRGLVLVKWWLLAIPHLLIVGIITSGAGTWGSQGDASGQVTIASWGPFLLGVLVLIAAVVLLFTGRYRHELFNLIMGINRWVYRVGAYVLLMRDEYPPFRLDQGPLDPQEHGPARGGPWERGGVAPAEAPRQ